MTKFKATLISIGFLATTGGCATTPPTQPAPVRESTSALFQVDDGHCVDLHGVHSIVFLRRGESNFLNTNDLFEIQIVPKAGNDNSMIIGYSDQTQALAVWKRLVAEVGGSVDEKKLQPAEMRPAGKTPAQTPAVPPPSKAEDSTGVGQLNLDLHRLEACHDQKLLTDDEFQRARAYIIAVYAGANGFQSQFDQLLENLAGVRESTENGLVNEKEAGQLKTAILKHYGIGE